MRLPRLPAIDDLAQAGANAWDLWLGDGVVKTHPTPRAILDEGPQRTVYRFLRRGWKPSRHAPVLLVPPLAAPAWCFDLRAGCSVAEHLIARGYPTYLVDYGPIGFSDRDLGLEHWVDEVIPRAVEAVQRDSGREQIQLVGWCLGGIMTLLSVASQQLPATSVAMVASPFDFTQVSMMAPIRRLAKLTGGALGTGLYRMLGGAPAPLVSVGFQLTAIDRYVTKPVVMAQHLHDRDWLAHARAVDQYMASMLAYPGRTFGQLYHQFFIENELAEGKLKMKAHTVDLADVRVPVLSVGGRGDVLAPLPAVHHVKGLLPNAPEVRLEEAPGGHLGVLTGRGAVRSTWRYLDDFLAANDVPGELRGAAAPSAYRASDAARVPHA